MKEERVRQKLADYDANGVVLIINQKQHGISLKILTGNMKGPSSGKLLIEKYFIAYSSPLKMQI